MRHNSWSHMMLNVTELLLIAALPASLASSAAFVPVAHADATFTVNSAADTVDAVPGNGICATAGGVCTLRAAIMETNALGGRNTIYLPAGTYTLTIPNPGGIHETAGAAGDLNIANDLTLLGAGAGVTIIDSNMHDRVFQIVTGTVTISGVTIQNGDATTSLSSGNTPAGGGGIHNGGVLTLINSTVAGSSAGYGGGIRNLGALTLINSAVLSNTAGPGAGLLTSGSLLSLTDSTISGNKGTGSGGAGVYIAGGTITIAHSTISSNEGLGSNGGGVYVAGGAVTVTDSAIVSNTSIGSNGSGLYIADGAVSVTNSAVSGNTATGSNGGGLYVAGGAVTVTGSTIDSNLAKGGNGGGLFALGGVITVTNSAVISNTSIDGGGIANFAVLTLVNNTVSGNRVAGSGGGILNAGTLDLNNVTIANSAAAASGGAIQSSAGAVTLRNTIVANSNPSNCSGAIISQGYNLDSDNTCSLGAQGDITNTNPSLSPLQDNGGPTWTHALLPGSPAIDAGNPATPGTGGKTCAATDQRGVTRPQGANCDIGAYEFTSLVTDLSVSKAAWPDPVVLRNPLTYTIMVTNTGPLTATGVIVTDTLPLQVTFGAITASQGSCSGTSLVTCHLGALNTHSTAMVTLTVTPTTAGIITNMASVTSDEFDPNLANNTAIASSTTQGYRAFLPLVLTP